MSLTLTLSQEMNPEEWSNRCRDVALKMAEATRPYLTPISAEVETEWGELVGSGAYVAYDDDVFVFTNAHVLSGLKGRRGGYHLRNSSEDGESASVIALEKPFGILTSPSDTAVVKVSSEAWREAGKASSAIPFSRFADTHAPVDRELLFFIGFSDERSKPLYKTLFTTGTPYTSQEPEGANAPDFPEHEFHVLYPIGLIEDLGEKQKGAPLPPGCSGSLVWNTRYIESIQNGTDWTPDDAMVTGILKRWIEKEELLTATRVERAGFRGLCDATKRG